MSLKVTIKDADGNPTTLDVHEMHITSNDAANSINLAPTGPATTPPVFQQQQYAAPLQNLGAQLYNKYAPSNAPPLFSQDNKQAQQQMFGAPAPFPAAAPQLFQGQQAPLQNFGATSLINPNDNAQNPALSDKELNDYLPKQTPNFAPLYMKSGGSKKRRNKRKKRTRKRRQSRKRSTKC
jgi:hypothetical protein